MPEGRKIRSEATIFSAYPASPASSAPSPVGTRPPLKRLRGWRGGRRGRRVWGDRRRSGRRGQRPRRHSCMEAGIQTQGQQSS